VAIGSRLPEIRISGIETFVPSRAWQTARQAARDALARLSARRCPGAELLGWLDLHERIRGPELSAIRTAAAELRERFPVLTVVGIGGSSLGARAALAALGHAADERAIPGELPCVVFAGHHLDGATLRETLASLAGVDYAVNVISKSGTTTEPGIAFRILLYDLRRRHG
jgi:glucose-6-phosphate isomerase